MVNKKRPVILTENEPYLLPSANDKMREFVTKFRIDMMEHVVSSINFAIENKLPIVEVFQFKNSPFVVTIAQKEFVSNLDHIKKFYEDREIFELCPRVDALRKILTKKIDEKETSSDSGVSYPTI